MVLQFSNAWKTYEFTDSFVTLNPFVFYVVLHLAVTTENGKHSIFDAFLFARECRQLSPTVRMYITRHDWSTHLLRESKNGIGIRKELIQRVRYTIFIIIEALVEQAEVIPKLVLKGPDLLQELHPILCRQ